MSTNPYARFLAGKDPLTVVHATADRMQALATKIGAAGMQKSYAPGKWTLTQILCHMADVEISWGMRLRQAVAQDHHVIQPFDQDAWARSYATLDPTLALASFIALRRWNAAFADTVAREEYGKPVTHPERGTMTFSGLLETMAGHDLNHLEQIEAIAAR